MAAQSRRHPAAELRPVAIARATEIEGRLIERYKRFFADIELPDGRRLTVHCPNPGSMLGTRRPGSRVRCSTSDNPKRKLRHTLEMIRVGRCWVGLHTLRANQLAERVLAAGAIPALGGYPELRREVRVEGGARLDFALEGHPGDPRPCFVEVKSVTLAEDGLARFPDAVTLRGRRHMETLAKLRAGGVRTALLFVVQRADCRAVAPADDIDPAYGEALRRAVDEGVEVHALRARVSAQRIRAEALLPVQL